MRLEVSDDASLTSTFRNAAFSRALVATTLATTLAAVLAGCGATVPGSAVPDAVPAADRALVARFVVDGNAASDAGPQEQARFLRATQEPGTPLPPLSCVATVALQTRLVDRTLRPDPDWTPPGRGGRRPAGAVYVAAAAVTATRFEGSLVSENVGSRHFVIQDGRVFGYAPCMQ